MASASRASCGSCALKQLTSISPSVPSEPRTIGCLSFAAVGAVARRAPVPVAGRGAAARARAAVRRFMSPHGRRRLLREAQRHPRHVSPPCGRRVRCVHVCGREGGTHVSAREAARISPAGRRRPACRLFSSSVNRFQRCVVAGGSKTTASHAYPAHPRFPAWCASCDFRSRPEHPCSSD
jgi:hypothetical protein